LPTGLFDADLVYSLDVAVKQDSLKPGSDSKCKGLFKRSGSAWSATLTYAQLSKECRLNPKVNGSDIAVSGFVGIFCLNKRDLPDAIVKEWVIPFEFVFPKALVSVYDPSVKVAPTVMNAVSAYTGGFTGSLKLYKDEYFRTEEDLHLYHVGDSIYVEHTLDDFSLDLAMTINSSWISRHLERDMPGVKNLTVDAVDDGKKAGRFKIEEIPECSNCYLHVVSKVSSLKKVGKGGGKGRRLSSGEEFEHFVAESIPIAVVGAGATVEQEVLPTLMLPLGVVLSLAFLGAIVLRVGLRFRTKDHSCMDTGVSKFSMVESGTCRP